MSHASEQPRLSVVVPVFGGAATLAHEVAALEAVLATCEPSYEVIVVTDGDPAAFAVAHMLASNQVRAIELAARCGKGAAVATGMLRARGELIGFMDAGGDIDPSAWNTLLTLQHQHHADAVVGSKWHPHSQVSYPLIRHVYSRGYHTLVQALFNLDVRDTQVGIKVFRAALVHELVPHLRVQRFAFDVELLALAQRSSYRTIIEAPVQIAHAVRSTVNLREVVRTAWDTLGIAWRLHVLRAYQPPRLEPAHLNSIIDLMPAQDDR